MPMIAALLIRYSESIKSKYKTYNARYQILEIL